MKLKFEQEKETKGTFKFAEVLEDELSEPIIGSLYVRKGGLKALGWQPGTVLEVELSQTPVAI